MSDTGTQVPDNFIVLEWADGEYLFRLPAGQIAELQTKCGTGIGKIYSRLWSGRVLNRDGSVSFNPLEAAFQYEDIVETIRLGLIGGGKGMVNDTPVEVNPAKAMQLIRNYVHPRPLLENWQVAAAILSAFVQGYTDPDANKKKGLSPSTPTMPMGGST
jgi:hypothetical protein